MYAPWSLHSTRDEPRITVPLVYPILSLTWRHPQPLNSNPRHQYWPFKRDTTQSGRCCLMVRMGLRGKDPTLPQCLLLPLLRKGLGQGYGQVIPLCPAVAGATPHLCPAPQQRCGRPPPQTRRTPEGHCPCLGPAIGSQRYLECPRETEKGKTWEVDPFRSTLLKWLNPSKELPPTRSPAGH